MGQDPGKTMSVRNMGRMLGIKKVESYWLVHKNYFDTILVNGTMRVVTESFEYWYAGQVKYHKIDGPPPGERLKKDTYSVEDIAEMFGKSVSWTYEILLKENVPFILVDYWKRFPKEAFHEWYRNQDKYVIQEDRQRIEENFGELITMPEMARMLDVPRSTVYGLLRNNGIESGLKTVMVGDRRHVTKESFDEWYASQSKYLKPEDQTEEYKKNHKSYQDCLKPKPKPKKPISVSSNPGLLTIDEAAQIAGVTRSTVAYWIKTGKIPCFRFSGQLNRIPRKEFESAMQQGLKGDLERRT